MARQLIGYKLRERRRQLGLTQSDVARRTGISPSYLSLIEGNKRPIAGAMLRRITSLLDLNPESLTGRAEERMVSTLAELAAEPMLRDLHLDPKSSSDLIGRHPAWARALLICWRAYHDQAQNATALSDRLSQDPELADTVHRLLTHVTAIRSASEILNSTHKLAPERRERFHAILSDESKQLSEIARGLATFFDTPQAHPWPITAADEVDDMIIERGNYIPSLERAAEALSRKVRRRGDALFDALSGFLAQAHGVRVAKQSLHAKDDAAYRGLCAYDSQEQVLVFRDHAPASTMQFEMARLVAELEARGAIDRELDAFRLTLPTARERAFRALTSYMAGAIVFPYELFHRDAEATRYDIELLGQRYGASFEQVAHRLVTLRRPGREGIPFGFLRTNPAGLITKRFPLPGLPFPGHGHGCPLWTIYRALQTPGRTLRQLVEFPSKARYLFIAQASAKKTAGFRDTPVVQAAMLACDALHADKTIYAHDLPLDIAESLALPVGPSCRLCPRPNCLHRAEDPIVGYGPAQTAVPAL